MTQNLQIVGYYYELATELVMPHILRGPRNGLSSEVVKKITSFAWEQFVEMSEKHSKFCETPTRCWQCIINYHYKLLSW